MGPDNSLFTPIEVAIKAALKQDPATLRRLARLDAKVVKICFSTPALELFVFPVADGVEFSTTWEDQIDCTIEGGAADFLDVLLDEQRTFGSGISLSGDTQIAIDLKNCLQKLAIDWEGLLADQIGDLAAHQLAQLFRAGHRYVRNSSHQLLDDLSDYLHEEIRVLPGKVELELFHQRVDDLRLQVDRLQARIDRLDR